MTFYTKAVMTATLIAFVLIGTGVGLFMGAQHAEILERHHQQFAALYRNQMTEALRQIVQNEIRFIRHQIAYEKINTQTLQAQTLERLGHLRFGSQNNGYFFVLDLHAIDGGPAFATELLLPVAPELEGKRIDELHPDATGYLYRQDYLEQIREKGEATVTYSYLKPDTRQPAPKISYLYHLKEWNWIIAAGFYLDDLQPVYESEKAAGEALIKEQLIYSAFGVMTIVALVAALYLVAHRQIQASFREYEDRIRAQNRTLLEQERRLSENAKIVAAGEIIKRVAHHWRQPLNAIGILIQDLIEAKKSGELNDSYLENNTQKAMGIINRMSHTIDQFRGFLNDEKEGVFDADKMVDQALILLRPELEEANILWQKAGGGEPLRVRGSSALFGRALLGLFVNAKEALQENPAKKSGEIALLLKKNGSRAQLVIEDNGPGIRDELKAQLFMPYVSTKGPGQGRGLGLYTARETIEAMGGTLQIESTGDKTRAVIDLPLV